MCLILRVEVATDAAGRMTYFHVATCARATCHTSVGRCASVCMSVRMCVICD